MRESMGLESGVRPPARNTAASLAPKRHGQSTGVAARTARAAVVTRNSPSPGAANATVARMRIAVDARIVSLMVKSESSAQREEARLELALLVHLHRSLASQMTQASHDVVLCDSLVEFSESVAQTLLDLEAGGARRMRRLLDHTRQLLAELAALGGPATQIKPEIIKARGLIDKPDSDLTSVGRHALALFSKLNDELDKRCPRLGGWIDDMTRP